MSGLEHYLSIFTKAVFIENIVLAYFLGLCSFLAISKNINASVGIGMAVVVVLTITAPINWFLWEFLLDKGALVWISEGFKDTDLGFLKLIVFISVIAAMVQLVEMFMERFSQSLYNSLGIFLPLIAVNCSILGDTSTPKSEAVIFSIGFFLAFIIFGNDAYLGSFNLRSQVTIAGTFISIISRPSSISLVTSNLLSLTSIFDANVACGQFNKALNI